MIYDNVRKDDCNVGISTLTFSPSLPPLPMLGFEDLIKLLWSVKYVLGMSVDRFLCNMGILLSSNVLVS